jgi:hypothetical protein
VHLGIVMCVPCTGLLPITDRERYHCIIDTVGKVENVNRALSVLADGGVNGIYGLDDIGCITMTISLACL